MNDEELHVRDPIQTQKDDSSTPENTTPRKEESLPPPPPPPRVLVSIKRWSENKQRYFYKPKDPDYPKNHYWKTTRDMQCTACGAIVSTAMFRHAKTFRCLMANYRVQKASDTTQNESRNFTLNRNPMNYT